ncbi:MAG: signal peptidase I [Alphaproteobacteria bacterium]|nr:signal peptidase I [Alphaproteobacteria bacterium]
MTDKPAAQAPAPAETPEKKEGFWHTVRGLIWAGLIALGIRTLAYEPFNIPSESMLPTLLVGDYLFVSKFSYGYSRHSMLFSPPLFKGRVFETPPKRGDVAVFKLPRDNSTDYIKRIVGLPGDRIQMRGGVLHLDGQPIRRERVEDFRYLTRSGQLQRLAQYRETLPDGTSFLTLDLDANGDLDNTREYVVPPGHYFAMGDNRDNSLDSRVPAGVGFVPAENLVGRADLMFFSTDGSAGWLEPWGWPSAIRFSRMFRPIR